MTTIAIVGCNHCGSTALARLLATGPNVWCGGELHWLVDLSSEEVGQTHAGWTVQRGCRIHGAACSVLTPDFLRHQFNEPTLYRAVLAKSGRGVLVSTDKFPRHIRRFLATTTDTLGIVLFKDPRSAFLSQVTTNRQGVLEAINDYVQLYTAILTWAPVFFPRLVWVDFSDLLARPLEELARIQSRLGMDLALTGALASDYCHVGGNEPAHSTTELITVAQHKKRLYQAERANPLLFVPVDGHVATNELYQRLRNQIT